MRDDVDADVEDGADDEGATKGDADAHEPATDLRVVPK